MISRNTYIRDMLRIIEPLCSMEGYANALRAAINFNIPCDEFTLDTNDNETIIKAINNDANIELVIKADHNENIIRHFVVYSNENKRALR